MRWRPMIVALGLGAASAAMAGPGDNAFSALLSCDADTLAKIGDSKSAFGTVAVKSSPGERPTKPPARYELDEATFASPVEAYGLHLLAFVRYVVSARSKTTAVTFAFRMAEPAPTVAKKLGELMKDVDSQQRDDEYGWLVELEAKWHTDGDGSAVEHQHPIRFVHLRPSAIEGHPEASLVECALGEVRVGKAPPPKLADLFLVAASTGSSAHQ